MTLYEAAFYFLIYGFLGWVIEVIFCSLEEKKPVNRGFLISPILPIYGFGMLIILFLNILFNKNAILFWLSATIILSAFEYLTSYVMEKVFKRVWWDYRSIPFNINGRVCLRHAIYWGFLAFFGTYAVHPIVERFVSMINIQPGTILVSVLIIVVLMDFLWGTMSIISENKNEAIIYKMMMAMRVKEREMREAIENEKRRMFEEMERIRMRHKRNLFGKLYYLRDKIKKIPNWSEKENPDK